MLALLVLLTGAWGLAQTAPAKRWLAAWIAEAAGTPGQIVVSIGALEGTLPFTVRARAVRVADAEGPWLDIDAVEVAWRPLAMLSGRAHLTRLVVSEATLLRIPAPAAEKVAGPPALSLDLPSLPIAVEVEGVRVERLVLEPGVAGAAAAMTVAGSGALEAGSARLRLDASRIDGTAGEAHVALALGAAGEPLTLSLSLREPEGGLLARALAIPGLPAVALDLTGEGPATAWQGRLHAAAGDGAAEAEVRLVLADGLSLSVQGDARPQGFFDGTTAHLVPEQVHLAGTLHWAPGGIVRVEGLSVVMPEATMTMQATIDPIADRVDGKADVLVQGLSRWHAMIAPVQLGTVRALASFGGTVRRPSARVGLTIEGGAIAGARARHVSSTLNLAADLDDGGIVTAVKGSGSGTVEGLDPGGDPHLAALVGPSASWSLTAEADLATGRVTVGQAHAEAGQLALQASGVLDLFGAATDATASVALRDLSPLAEPIGTTVAGSLEADLRARGDILQPRLTVDVAARLAGLAVGEAGAASLLGPAPIVTGTLALDGAAVSLEPLTIAGAGGTATLRGTIGATVGLEVTATVPEVAPLAAAYGEAVTGLLEADARVDGTLAGPDLAIVAAADLTGASLGDSVLDALTGGRVAASGLVLVQGDTVLLDAARLEGRHATLEGAGRLASPLDLRVRATVARLAPLGPSLGIELAGGMRAEGRMTGTLGDPAVEARLHGERVAVQGVALDALKGTVQAQGLAREPSLRVALDMRSPLGPTDAASRIAVMRGGAVRLNGISVSAPGASVSGDLALLRGGLLDGRITAHVDDLEAIGPLAGMTLGGSAALEAMLAADAGRQGVMATLRGTALAAGLDGGTRLAAAALTLDVRMTDALGAPGGTAALDLADVRVGEVLLASARLAAEGDGGLLRLAGSAAGEAGPPVALDLAGELAIEGGRVRLRLDRMDGSYGTVAASLAAPLTLEHAPNLVAFSGLDAVVGEGRVIGQGRLAAGEVMARVTVDALPVAALAALGGVGNLDGTVAADVSLSGPAGSPSLLAEIRLSDLREAGLAEGTALGVHGSLQAKVANGRANLAASLGGPPDLAVEASVAAPAALSVEPLALEVAPAGPLSGSVDVHVDVGLLPRLVDLRGDALGGRLDAAMTLGGTVGAPDLRGTAQVTGGSFASAEAGTVLAAVEARLHGDRDRIVLDGLTATDGGRGRLQAAGSIELIRGGGRAGRIEATLTRFRAVRRPAATVDVSGSVLLARSPGGASILGAITVDEAELRIPERRPAGIVTLPVTEINRPPGRERQAERNPAEPGLPVSLDVRVHAPGHVFLRGRGLNSEWQGDLRVQGTLEAPDIVGELRVLRGDFLFIDKEFKVETGVVGFVGGGTIDPNLNFSAVAQVPDVTARVRVTGTASAPQFALTSEPALPEDEVLSRLLFGKDAGGLSAAQAFQLAQVATELGGGRTGGMMDELRRGIGLDALGFGTDEDTGDSTLSAGKYVSDEVYVRVQQGLTPESRTVGVEVRVLPQVVVEGDVGGEGDGRVGVNWRYDY